MSLLSGFTRPSDPINATDLAALISTALGKMVSAEITSSDILVNGDTLNAQDQTAVQTAINNYYFGYLQYGAPISDVTDMSTGRHDRGITERVAYQGDLATYNAAVAIAQRKAWVSGVLKPNSFIYYSKSTTSNGNVVFYLTDDGTSNGNPVFNNVYADSVTISPYGASAIYQISGIVVSNDKKSITATVNQVNSVVLGLVQIVSSANSIQCNLLVLGD